MANSQDNKEICPVCRGNGFLLVDNNWNNFFQCEVCKSEGEIQKEKENE
jgi:DnaJ-class molecular chaperone